MNVFKSLCSFGLFSVLCATMLSSAHAFVETSSIRAAAVRNNCFSTPTKKSLRPPPSFKCPTASCTDCLPANLMICRAVSDFSDEPSTSDSEHGASSDTARRSGVFAGLQQRVFAGSTLKERLIKASNFASMLCVLDCTILPIITVILPLFGIVAASPAQMEWLHELGHQLALWFVLPVGGLATTLNYSNHRKLWIAAMGWCGLVAVVGANIGCHMHLPGALGHAMHDVLHALHHGILHRVTNLAGCALLLTSNYFSRKQGGCKDPSCTHQH